MRDTESIDERISRMPRGYEHLALCTIENEKIITPYVNRLTADYLGTKYVLTGVNDKGVLYWSKPRQKKQFVLDYRIKDLPERAE